MIPHAFLYSFQCIQTIGIPGGLELRHGLAESHTEGMLQISVIPLLCQWFLNHSVFVFIMFPIQAPGLPVSGADQGELLTRKE